MEFTLLNQTLDSLLAGTFRGARRSKSKQVETVTCTSVDTWQGPMTIKVNYLLFDNAAKKPFSLFVSVFNTKSEIVVFGDQTVITTLQKKKFETKNMETPPEIRNKMLAIVKKIAK